ncbi:LAQU0S04e06084g1_1 [Lachancea quebecensis]|uniref:LAQU0S04e06084g1_1 n=1 Tax=Lachancea quebecensis TaxID=1654605 RepID=A0A0P1KQP2_9SACH|nr:LAQU0S04e06084g1_1 [Lachancea quebecensis]
MLFGALWCSLVLCGALRCSAVLCGALRCSLPYHATTILPQIPSARYLLRLLARERSTSPVLYVLVCPISPSSGGHGFCRCRVSILRQFHKPLPPYRCPCETRPFTNHRQSNPTSSQVTPIRRSHWGHLAQSFVALASFFADLPDTLFALLSARPFPCHLACGFFPHSAGVVTINH